MRRPIGGLMSKIATRALLLLSLMAVVLSGCLFISEFTVYCDRANLSYFEGSNEGPYELQVFRSSDNEAISDVSTVDGTGSVTIEFYEKQTENTSLYLVIDGSPHESESVNCSETGTSGTTWFEPGDDRINRQAYAYASVYCDADNERVGIYGIHSLGAGDPDRNDGMGYPAIFVPYTELPGTPTSLEGNLLIASYGNIGFYRLTSGEYQVNAGPDPEGKTYVLIWDGCPQTYVQAYILQDGVMTQTEVYPR
jgi:hypothetical protein